MGWLTTVPVGTITGAGDVPHASGRFYDSRLANAYTTVALVANTLYGVPFYVPMPTTYTSIGVEVTTLSSGKSVRLGIYNDTGGAPSSRVLDAGTISTTTTGGKTIVISQLLTSGWYWLAAVSDGTASVRASTVAGSQVILGFTSGTDVTIHDGWSVSFSFAALPDPFTGGGALMTTAPPRLMLGV